MPPIPAATVILLRDGPAGGVETFLLRRHKRSSFMSDHFVFPGGKQDAGDADERYAVAGALSAAHAALLGDGFDPTAAAPLYVTAARELFEEAGVLLARGRDRAIVSFTEPDRAARFAEHRRALRAGERDLPAVLAAEGLDLAIDELHFFAWWTTPSVEPKRFDARFFVAACPPGQSPLADQEETVEHRWLSPTAAIAEYRERRIKLPPPTLRNLEDLAAVASTTAARDLAHERHRWPIRPILPKGTMLESGEFALLLPWDPLYAATPGEGDPISPPHPLAVGASRFVLARDLWEGRTA